jgi:glycosyltransferase involved in cell wall biosynthesis
MLNKSKKKLIIFMPSIEGGGVEKNLFIICNYLISRMKTVKVLTANEKDKKYFNKQISFLSPKSYFWQNRGRALKTLVCMYLLLKERLKERNLVVFSFQANIATIIFCKLFGLKVIARSNAAPSVWSKILIKKKIFKLILPLADEVIVNSFQFKRDLDLSFGTNSKCIYNPLDKKKIEFLSKKKNNLKFFNNKSLNLINVGRLTKQKDHLTLLKAIKKLSTKIPLKLLIIGRGYKKNSITNFIKLNKLEKIIKIISYNKNPFKYIKQSDAFILSSIYEGLPNVLLEAICLKKFIISTDCPTGPREILKNGKLGLLFKTGNVEMLASKIEYFYKNKKSMKNKINNAYLSLDRFDYNNNLNKYFSVLKKYIC